jgi:hypothetical protein
VDGAPGVPAGCGIPMPLRMDCRSPIATRPAGVAAAGPGVRASCSACWFGRERAPARAVCQTGMRNCCAHVPAARLVRCGGRRRGRRGCLGGRRGCNCAHGGGRHGARHRRGRGVRVAAGAEGGKQRVLLRCFLLICVHVASASTGGRSDAAQGAPAAPSAAFTAATRLSSRSPLPSCIQKCRSRPVCPSKRSA